MRDDFGYLMWGLLHRDEPLAWLHGPEWQTYHRPINALVWWVGAKGDLLATLPRIGLVVSWVAAGLALMSAQRRSPGVWVLGLLLLLTNQVWMDVLAWRSWLTTAGSLALMAWGLRQRKPGWVLALGILALGFKEMAALALASVAFVRPELRRVGAVLFVAVVVAAMGSVSKLGVHHLLANARFHLDTLGLFLPLVPLALTVLRPATRPVWVLSTALLTCLPGWASGLTVVVCLGLWAFVERSQVPALGLCLAVPLFGEAQARQYLCELWFVAALGLVARVRAPMSWGLLLAVALCGLPSSVDFERARAGGRERFDAQLEFVRSFHPSPARILYHPNPAWSWDLDALVWVRDGAVLGGVPPDGTRPVEVGPLSGVWADLIYGSGSQ